uniref:receptor protein serine/threonine kinase n=1 Tax=Caenorhabditis tropicalis TaxID=1561998 RepID=A0A1I7TVQ9_9PELO
MRIKFLVFFLVFTIGVLPTDDFVTKQADLFVQERLIPALIETKSTHVNLSRIHLCFCSTEIGCNAKTTGWLGASGIGLTKEEKALYKNVCYTDGDCYQNARPLPEISHFGCMDVKLVTDETDFHDTAAKICNNMTSGSHTSYWICCDDEHFCANETVIDLPPSPFYSASSKPFTWIITVLGLGLIVILILVVFKKKPKWAKTLEYYVRYQVHQRTSREDNDSKGSTTAESHDRNIHTMSTSVGTHRHEPIPDHFQRMICALEESSGSGLGPTRLTDLTLSGQISILGTAGCGRFGTVHFGSFKDEMVAVKKFKDIDDSAFTQELEIYESRMLRHPNILRYVGSDRVGTFQTIESWLIIEYHPLGSLHDYLRSNTINIETYYDLMRSAANGLAFLHMKLAGNQKSSKPMMAHRDVKSRNIMVKSDLTCALGDFGLSLCEPEEKDTPATTNYKCGTVRYLAPEILNNTLQSTIFESFQSADVYSFALVMWETMCRFQDDKIKAKSEEEFIPYGHCTPREPNDKTMHEVVCIKKRRPLINPLWYKHSELKIIMEIMGICWNENPSARYTAYHCRRRMDERFRLLFKTKDKLTTLVTPPAEVEEEKRRAELRVPQRDSKVFPSETNTPQPILVADVEGQEKIELQNGIFTGQDETKNPLLG